MIKISIASIGDCCVDVYPKEKKYYLGGTAFNRAVWLAQNGARVSLVSAIGTDDWGKKYLAECRRLNINTDYLATKTGSTSHVDITLNQHQQPQFSAWYLGVLKNFTPESLPQNQDAIILTYLKPIKQLTGLKLTAPFTAIDFCGGSIYSPSLTAIKPLLPKINLAIRSSSQAEMPHLKKLAARFNKMILATLGKDGSILFSGNQEFCQPAMAAKTQDTTGAGDVYISSFVVNYLTSKNIPLAMEMAAAAATQAITSPRYLAA